MPLWVVPKPLKGFEVTSNGSSCAGNLSCHLLSVQWQMAMFLLALQGNEHTWLSHKGGCEKNNRADDITVTGLQIDCHNDYIEWLITELSSTKIVALCAQAAAKELWQIILLNRVFWLQYTTRALYCISKLLLRSHKNILSHTQYKKRFHKHWMI